MYIDTRSYTGVITVNDKSVQWTFLCAVTTLLNAQGTVYCICNLLRDRRRALFDRRCAADHSSYRSDQRLLGSSCIWKIRAITCCGVFTMTETDAEININVFHSIVWRCLYCTKTLMPLGSVAILLISVTASVHAPWHSAKRVLNTKTVCRFRVLFNTVYW